MLASVRAERYAGGTTECLRRRSVLRCWYDGVYGGSGERGGGCVGEGVGGCVGEGVGMGVGEGVGEGVGDGVTRRGEVRGACE